MARDGGVQGLDQRGALQPLGDQRSRQLGGVAVAGPAAVHEGDADGGARRAEIAVAQLLDTAGLLRAAIGHYRVARQALAILVGLGEQPAADIVGGVGDTVLRMRLRAVQQQPRRLDGVAAQHVVPRGKPQRAAIGPRCADGGNALVGVDLNKIRPRLGDQPRTCRFGLCDMDGGIVFRPDRAYRHAAVAAAAGRPAVEGMRVAGMGEQPRTQPQPRQHLGHRGIQRAGGDGRLGECALSRRSPDMRGVARDAPFALDGLVKRFELGIR